MSVYVYCIMYVYILGLHRYHYYYHYRVSGRYIVKIFILVFGNELQMPRTDTTQKYHSTSNRSRYADVIGCPA